MPFIRQNIVFLLTVFFGTLGWCGTHYVDQMETAPIIRYSKKVNTQQTEISYRIKNISRKINFTKIHFFVTLDENKPGRCKEEIGFKIYPPMHLGENREPPKCTSERISVELSIPNFQPGNEFDLTVNTDEIANSALRVTCDNPVLLLKKSIFATDILEHEIIFLLIFISFWVIVIFITFFCMIKFTKHHKTS